MADGKTYEWTNIIARFYTAQRRVVLATHYGSNTLVGKRESSSASAANDGSGVAVLVELARSFGDSNVPPDFGIDLVFLDGVGAGWGLSTSAHEKQPASTYFAQHLHELYGDNPPVLAILLDDVCRANLRLLKEQSSMRSAAVQMQAFWKIAQRIAPNIFQDRVGLEIEDDQAPLIQAGIPSVLLIDSEYPHLPIGKCSPRSLETVGQAIMQYVSRPEKSP